MNVERTTTTSERQLEARLQGKSVLVTGASRGLGAALAREAARRGARVVLTARHEAEVKQVADAIQEGGGTAFALAADVGDKQSIYPTAGAAQALVGPIDVLVHNASTLGPTPLPLLLDTECEDLEHVLAVNLVGPFRLTKAVLGSMVVRRRGLVVFVTSDAAVNGYPGWGAYGVSKAGLEQLARTWAAELDGTGVRVVTIDPGEMNTRMHADAIPEADPSTLADPADVARIVADIVEADDAGPRAWRSGARIEASSWGEKK